MADNQLEAAVLALQNDPHFVLIMAEIERLRTQYYEKHVITLPHDAPATLVASNIGVLNGLEQAFRAPENILAAARKARLAKPQEYAGRAEIS